MDPIWVIAIPFHLLRVILHIAEMVVPVDDSHNLPKRCRIK